MSVTLHKLRRAVEDTRDAFEHGLADRAFMDQLAKSATLLTMLANRLNGDADGASPLEFVGLDRRTLYEHRGLAEAVAYNGCSRFPRYRFEVIHTGAAYAISVKNEGPSTMWVYDGKFLRD